MKLKKILSLLFLTPLVISCNNNSMAGTYKFQMGKEKGTHFGLFLELKDNPYTAYEDVKDCKELELSFDASFATEELGSILDLLKNEYFGDLLMFSNIANPLSLRVKSKRVELYVLRKKDALSIKKDYPNE